MKAQVQKIRYEKLTHTLSKDSFYRAYGEARHRGGSSLYCVGDGTTQKEALAQWKKNAALIKRGKAPETSKWDQPDEWWEKKLGIKKDAGDRKHATCSCGRRYEIVEPWVVLQCAYCEAKSAGEAIAAVLEQSCPDPGSYPSLPVLIQFHLHYAEQAHKLEKLLGQRGDRHDA